MAGFVAHGPNDGGVWRSPVHRPPSARPGQFERRWKEPRPTEAIDVERLRAQLRHILNAAIAEGRYLAVDTDLGLRTRAAVAMVVVEHPDASAELIARVYDAFDSEHGR